MATKTIDQQGAHKRQLLRRSNATVPIPSAKHKRSRSHHKQQLRSHSRASDDGNQ